MEIQTITFEMNDQDIEQGKRLDSHDCPVARLICRTIDPCPAEVEVCADFIYLRAFKPVQGQPSGVMIDLDVDSPMITPLDQKAILQFLNLFDGGEVPAPIRFRLTLPRYFGNKV